jgi:hypothetical protein
VKQLPVTPALLRVARRVVWFDEPAQALADPVLFLAHVMVFGTVEDLAALRGVVGQGRIPRGAGARAARHLRRGAALAGTRRFVPDRAGAMINSCRNRNAR